MQPQPRQGIWSRQSSHRWPPNPPPNRSKLEDGRLDELAARYGVTIRQVRRMMGPQQLEHPSAVATVDSEEVVRPPGGPAITAAEEPSSLDNGRLEELAATLGVTPGDVVG
jgi:hypothetical protein